MVKLSDKAIKDLRQAIQLSYGSDFEKTLDDQDLQEIGKALLVITSEHLKIKAHGFNLDNAKKLIL